MPIAITGVPRGGVAFVASLLHERGLALADGTTIVLITHRPSIVGIWRGFMRRRMVAESALRFGAGRVDAHIAIDAPPPEAPAASEQSTEQSEQSGSGTDFALRFAR